MNALFHALLVYREHIVRLRRTRDVLCRIAFHLDNGEGGQLKRTRYGGQQHATPCTLVTLE